LSNLSKNHRTLNDVKEEVRSRINLADYIGKHCKLIKNGMNYKACCPLPGHDEKTPSFHVNTSENYFYCFGCKKGGDIFSFTKYVEGLDFIDSLKGLAESLSIQLPKQSSKEFTKISKQKNQQNQDLEFCQRANEFFQKQIKQELSKKHSLVKDYLISRNLKINDVNQFQLGWSGSGNKLLEAIKGNQEFVKSALKLGLLKTSDSRKYDFFRDRLIIPILDHKAKSIGFSARIIAEKKNTGKYINSSESNLFQKKKVLYGLTKETIRLIQDSGYVVIVEGFFDQWSLVKKKIPAVAVMGTAITKFHLSMLSRFCNEAILIMDNDKAGETSCIKSLQDFYNDDWNIKVFNLPKNFKDPDEWLTSKNLSTTEISTLLRKAPEGIKWWSQLIVDSGRKEGLNKFQILKKLKKVWPLAIDPAVKVLFAKDLSLEFQIPTNEIYLAMGEAKTNKINVEVKPVVFSSTNKLSTASENQIRKNLICKKIITQFIFFPQCICNNENYISLLTSKILDNSIKSFFKKYTSIDSESLKDIIKIDLHDGHFLEPLNHWISEALINGPDVKDGNKNERITFELINSLRREELKSLISLKKNQIKLAEKSNSDDLGNYLMELQQLRIKLESEK